MYLEVSNPPKVNSPGAPYSEFLLNQMPKVVCYTRFYCKILVHTGVGLLLEASGSGRESPRTPENGSLLEEAANTG